MQAADHVEFGGAFAHALFGALVDFFEREGVSAGRVGIAAEGAQLAVRDADVGGIDVAIDVEEADVAVALLAHVIGEPADGQQVGRAVERDAVFGGQALAGQHLFGDRLQPRVVDLKFGHGLCSTGFSLCGFASDVAQQSRRLRNPHRLSRLCYSALPPRPRTAGTRD